MPQNDLKSSTRHAAYSIVLLHWPVSKGNGYNSVHNCTRKLFPVIQFIQFIAALKESDPAVTSYQS